MERREGDVTLSWGFRQNDFKAFKTDDYSVQSGKIDEMNHQCKMGYVSVLNEKDNLSQNVGDEVLRLLEEEKLLLKTNSN